MVEIVYVDADIVVANKPAGLLTHPSKLCPQDSDSLLQQLRKQLGEWVYPVHRLDRATSGIIVMGRSPTTAASLSQAMSQQLIFKTYLAVVRGHLHGQGVINKPLLDAERSKPVPAVTQWSNLACGELPWAVRPYETTRLSLLALRPQTGRMHQIRKHLQSRSHPIIGDRIYGDGAHNRSFAQRTAIKRLLLHAYSLELTHPRHQQRLTLTAPLPLDFASALSLFNLDTNTLTNIASKFYV